MSKKGNSSKRLVVGLSLFLLITAVGFQVISSMRYAPTTEAREPLKAVFPHSLGGVVAKDEPIATSEEMKKAVTELLNYDDAVYRIFQLPRYRLSVYVAWWQAGKMSPRLVSAHTPDICWPGNGWTRDLEAERPFASLNDGLITRGVHSGEVRVFNANAKPEYVVFWHRVGTTFINYDTAGAPPWWAFLGELWENGLRLKQAQLFVRISADVPLTTLLADPELQPLWDALKREGLGSAAAQ